MSCAGAGAGAGRARPAGRDGGAKRRKSQNRRFRGPVSLVGVSGRSYRAKLRDCRRAPSSKQTSGAYPRLAPGALVVNHNNNQGSFLKREKKNKSFAALRLKPSSAPTTDASPVPTPLNHNPSKCNYVQSCVNPEHRTIPQIPQDYCVAPNQPGKPSPRNAERESHINSSPHASSGRSDQEHYHYCVHYPLAHDGSLRRHCVMIRGFAA